MVGTLKSRLNNGWKSRGAATKLIARGVRRGFTLVELLVVIAIIGTLVGPPDPPSV